jgi:hypothetical protein
MLGINFEYMYHLKINGIQCREISNFSYTVFIEDIHDTIFSPFLGRNYKLKYGFTFFETVA